MRLTLLSVFLFAGSSAFAQTGSPGLPDRTDSAPVYSMSTVAQPTSTLTFRPTTPIQIDFTSSWLLPKARGEADITPIGNGLRIEVKVKGLCPASDLGPAYLTYVLWAVSSSGKTFNLGEIMLKGSTGLVAANTELDAFAMFITAEPYFAVTEPSDAVILRNSAPTGALRYKLAPDLLPLLHDRETPMDLIQARNAVRIARRVGAERLASTALNKAVALLGEAEQKYRGDDLWQTVMKAREATEAAEVARVIAAKSESE